MFTDDFEPCDVREATHVRVGSIMHEIASKGGIDEDGRLAKPSNGGFFVTTTTGRKVTMWEASRYYKAKPATGCQRCGANVIPIQAVVPAAVRMDVGRSVGISYSLGAGSGVPIDMTLCVECGQIQGKWRA